MTAPVRSIEVVQNLVLDTIAPFIQRIEDLETELGRLLSTPTPAAQTASQTPQHVSDEAAVLQTRLDAVIALHSLDAVPAQWEFRAGKQEAAPDGLWEITCQGCDYKVQWLQGDPEPKRCKTVQKARGTA